jgi:CheY-like chemotaxis protein
MRLPIYSPPAARSDSERPAGSARKKAQPHRILIVDDNRDAAEALALLLTMDGHEVRIAYDGFEALDVGSAFAADVVLLDLGMPKMNGCDAARRIREQPWGRSAFLVALTGWGQPQDRERTADAGFDLHLVKPVDQGELALVLARLTDGRAEQGRRARVSRSSRPAH